MNNELERVNTVGPTRIENADAITGVKPGGERPSIGNGGLGATHPSLQNLGRAEDELNAKG
jgi:hypothetical protein